MNPPTFKYRGFGLKIASDIEFPELFQDDFELEDVKIKAGPIDDPWFENHAARRVYQSVEPDIFRLQIPDAGRYLVKKGNLVQMEPWGASDPTAFRMYGLTIGFSACLLQRNLTMLHASGIISSDAVFLFAGASGAGKSTLISQQMRMGQRIFTDDVCVFDGARDAQNRWLAAASYPILKMKEKALQAIFPTAQRWQLWPDDGKYGMPFHPQFQPYPMPVGGLAFITKQAGIRQIEVERVEGVRAFQGLAQCTYRPGLIQDTGQQAINMRVIAGLANSTPVFHIKRPDQANDGSELCEAMEQLIKQVR